MVGSQNSTHKSRFWRHAIALFAVLTLVATACGGAEVDTAPVMERSPEEQLADLAAPTPEPPAPAKESGAVAESPVDTTNEAASVGDDVDDLMAEALESAADELVEEASSTDDAAQVTTTSPATSQVLAFAVEQSEDLSYSYEQGMSMELNLFGMEMNAVSDEPLAVGIIDGDASYAKVDMGSFMESMMSGFDLGGTVPQDELAAIDFDSMVIEAWADGDTVVLDMSQYINALADMDPFAAAELAEFADGPVKFNAASLAAAQGVDVGDIVTQMGSGAQFTDPAALFDALRNIEVVDEVGTDSVNGVAVTVYSGKLNFAAYSDALGVDVMNQMGGLGDMGIDPNDPMMADIVESLNDVLIDMTVMIDDEDLVRRMDISMDMSPMFEGLFGSFAGEAGDDEMAAMFAEMEMSAKVDTWQTFDDYGAVTEIIVPDAPEASPELLGLLES